MRPRRLFHVTLRTAVVVAVLGVAGAATATKIRATAPVSMYCAVGSSQSGGISKTDAPRPGQRCFTKYDDAVQAIGDNSVGTGGRPGVEVNVPPGATYNANSCSMSIPASVHVPAGKAYFVHCTNGLYVEMIGR